MSAMRNFDPAGFGGAVASLGCAFVLGGLIGLERQYRQRTAGLRTNVLVATGAAAFVDLGTRTTPTGPPRSSPMWSPASASWAPG
jgi:putative Mg2+ transporter-C (MgtC) family protein